jgi:hypothetical protein
VVNADKFNVVDRDVHLYYFFRNRTVISIHVQRSRQLKSIFISGSYLYEGLLVFSLIVVVVALRGPQNGPRNPTKPASSSGTSMEEAD